MKCVVIICLTPNAIKEVFDLKFVIDFNSTGEFKTGRTSILDYERSKSPVIGTTDG